MIVVENSSWGEYAGHYMEQSLDMLPGTPLACNTTTSGLLEART